MKYNTLMPWNSGVNGQVFYVSIDTLSLCMVIAVAYHHYKIFISRKYAPFQGDHYYIKWMCSDFVILLKLFHSYDLLHEHTFSGSEKI